MPKTPNRTCVACRGAAPQSDLVRFAKLADGRLAADPERRLPGRGAYLHPTPACLEAAAKRRSLERALGGSLTDGWVHSVVPR